MSKNEITAPHLSDYGIYNADACDIDLRNRVIKTVQQQRDEQAELGAEQLAELATYISELEDALLRYHWGALEHHQINEILKCSTGLDIEARASALDAMAAADA